MKLAEFARLVGLTAEHISMIERGLRGGTLDALEKIALAGGATLADLFAEPPTEEKCVASKKTRRRKAG